MYLFEQPQQIYAGIFSDCSLKWISFAVNYSSEFFVSWLSYPKLVLSIPWNFGLLTLFKYPFPTFPSLTVLGALYLAQPFYS